MRAAQIDKQDLIELYVNRQLSTKEIGSVYGVTGKTIRQHLHKNGIKVRQSNVNNRKHFFDETYFDTIDSYNKAYLLGFICADGWVAKNRVGNCDKLGVGIHRQDEELLLFMKKELSSENHKITEKKDVYRIISFCSVHMAGTLNSYGVVPNKSLVMSIEDVINRANIPQEFIPSFILGYFDGDGGIYSCPHTRCKTTIMWSCGFTGTMDTVLFLKRYFNDVGFIIDEKAKSGLTYTYSVSGRNRVNQVLSVLYDNHKGFCLKRKKDKFIQMKSPTK